MLLALDFAGDVVDVVSQPLKISFGTCGKRRSHIPDYLTVTRHGVWLIDIRPEAPLKGADQESFAAAAEVAVACGWRYAAAARWREHAFAGLDARAPRRRLRFDPPGRCCSPRPPTDGGFGATCLQTRSLSCSQRPGSGCAVGVLTRGPSA